MIGFSVQSVDLNSRAMHYAARWSCATRRHRFDGGDEFQTVRCEGVSGWNPYVSPTWRACPDAPHIRPIFGLDMGVPASAGV